MTTRTRENSLPGKEKRGTSPSTVTSSTTTPRRRSSPVPSKTVSPARSDDSDKRVPNYLRGTASSGTDVSKQQGKKLLNTTTDTPHKPNVARRRSLDKPPSPSRTTVKTRVSPVPTVRSSSSTSGKISTTPHKLSSDRTLKGGPKDVGKQHTLYARPVTTVKKAGVTATAVKKKATGSGATSITKAQMRSPPEKVHNVIPEPEMESNDEQQGDKDLVVEDQEHEDQGDKDLVVEDQEHEDQGVKELVVEDQEHEDQGVVEDQEHEDQGVKDLVVEDQGVKDSVLEDQEEPAHESDETETVNSEIQEPEIADSDTSPVSEHDHDDSLVTKTDHEELDEKPDVEEVEEVEEQSMNESKDENVEVTDDVEDNKTEQPQQQEELTELSKSEEAHESEEAESQQVVMEQKVEGEDEQVENEQVIQVAVPSVQVGHGSKDSPVSSHGKKDSPVSNDVIEETASKLREQRKNKVKALAGAFETVISQQESK